jgi:predicted AAA+ superfamily ATPase
MRSIDILLEIRIQEWLFKGKIIAVFGPRQLGKTTLVKTVGKTRMPGKFYNYDIQSVARYFIEPEPVLHKRLLGNAALVVIDEAQNVRNMGKTLKVINDSMPEIQVIATGSSSFVLGHSLNEGLAGRGGNSFCTPFP